MLLWYPYLNITVLLLFFTVRAILNIVKFVLVNLVNVCSMSFSHHLSTRLRLKYFIWCFDIASEKTLVFSLKGKNVSFSGSNWRNRRRGVAKKTQLQERWPNQTPGKIWNKIVIISEIKLGSQYKLTIQLCCSVFSAQGTDDK